MEIINNSKTAKEEMDIRKTVAETFDKSFFVEAGAGAGKTTLIVRRIVNQLKAGFKPERIVAITFTNMSARDLKTKILKGIQEELKTGVITEDERKALSDAQDGLDRMQISTIHSFCHRLLSEKCFDVGLPMGFELMEEEDSQALFDGFFVKWVEKNLKYTDWNKLAADGAERWKVYGRLGRLAKRLSAVSPDINVTQAAKVLPPQEYEDKADKLISYVKHELDDATTAIPYGWQAFSQVPKENLIKFFYELQQILDAGDRHEILSKLIKLFDPKAATHAFKVSKKELVPLYTPGCKTKKEAGEKADKAIADIKLADQQAMDHIMAKEDDIEELVNSRLNEMYLPYLDYAKRAADEYRASFPPAEITNDLLLQKTYELLNNSEEIRSFFADKFDCIYVDEYQDTDHIQDSFIKLLAEKPGKPGTLRDGALFVVGDPKQSIYRFRGAEPEVYFKTGDWMRWLDNAYVCSLSINFRSDPSIIDWVNASFAAKNITDGKAYVPMIAAPVNYPAPANNAKLISGIYLLDDVNAKDKKDGVDAENLCKLIKGMTGICDIKDQGNIRKVRYSDFLVLCANMSGMEVYARKMQEYGIPFVMNGEIRSSGYYFINAFIRVYAFLAEPYERKAVAGAKECLLVSGAEDESLNMEILMNMRKDTRNMSGYGCLKYLMEHIGLIIKKDDTTDIYTNAALQRRLTQMTEYVLSSAHESRSSVLSSLQKFSEGKIERELIMEEDQDVVRFMNLHKAKGLEGRIVIWTNRTENRSFKNGEYLSGGDFYPALVDKNDHNSTPVWWAYNGDKGVEDRAQNDDSCERIRLEYVAVTRAIEALIFMTDMKSEGESLFSEGYDLGQCLDASPFACGQKSTAQNNPSKLTERTLKELRTDAKEAKKYSVSKYRAVSPSELEDKSAGKDVKKNDESTGRVRGNIIGLSMHRCFELVLERGAVNDNTMAVCIAQALNENSENIPEDEFVAYRKFLEDALKAFVNWFNDWEVYKKAEKIYTELPFSYMIDEAGKPPVWMHGEADLVIKCNDDTAYIIDYKSDDDTGYPDEDSFRQYLFKKYTPQVIEYKKAISGIFEIPAEKIGLSLVSFSYKITGDGSMGLRITDI